MECNILHAPNYPNLGLAAELGAALYATHSAAVMHVRTQLRNIERSTNLQGNATLQQGVHKITCLHVIVSSCSRNSKRIISFFNEIS